MNHANFTLSWGILVFTFFASAGITLAQDATPSAPLNPLIDNDSNSQNTLMDLLKNDLIRRYQDMIADEPNGSSRKPRRPRPELGQGKYGSQPIDISKYIGTEGDANKAIDRLRELGKIPYPQDIPFPKSATGEHTLWSDVSPKKRMNFARDLFKRRKYENAQRELEALLDRGIKGDDLFDALVMREKCLFHRRFYDRIEDDYYRLKSYYPKKKKEIQGYLTYIEEKSGLRPLQQEVLKNPGDPKVQRTLLSLYEKLGWLDFAEDFFLVTINDTSPPTIKSLSEIYFKKKDLDMLIALARKAQQMYPNEGEFYYNEGVGLYLLGDPTSLKQAKSAFLKAQPKAKTARLRNHIDWYLKRLENVK